MSETPIDRWISHEMRRMQEGLVVAPRSLSELLLEEAPSIATRGGGTHVFDKAALARVAALLSPLDRRRLRLPVTFFVVREGRAWLGHARARGLAARYPTIFQFVQH